MVKDGSSPFITIVSCSVDFPSVEDPQQLPLIQAALSAAAPETLQGKHEENLEGIRSELYRHMELVLFREP